MISKTNKYQLLSKYQRPYPPNKSGTRLTPKNESPANSKLSNSNNIQKVPNSLGTQVIKASLID